MVQNVQGVTYYQFTCTKPYKQAFQPGQRVRIGDSYNRFFGFYEGSRQYPVTMPDGSIVQVKANSFLKQIRDGLINCPLLPQIASEVATHYIMLARELIMEQIRSETYSNAPSRQRCLFLVDTLDEAREWQQRIDDPGSVCSIEVTGLIHRADSNLLLGDSEPLAITRDRAHAYWQGEVSDRPAMESLFVGDALIVDTAL